MCVRVRSFQSSSQYREDCSAGIESFVCLSLVGWLFTIIFTYLGFTLLFTATMWNARILEKLSIIHSKWKELRKTSVDVEEAHRHRRRTGLERGINTTPSSAPSASVVASSAASSSSTRADDVSGLLAAVNSEPIDVDDSLTSAIVSEKDARVDVQAVGLDKF